MGISDTVDAGHGSLEDAIHYNSKDHKLPIKSEELGKEIQCKGSLLDDFADLATQMSDFNAGNASLGPQNFRGMRETFERVTFSGTQCEMPFEFMPQATQEKQK